MYYTLNGVNFRKRNERVSVDTPDLVAPSFNLGKGLSPHNRNAVGTLHRSMYRVHDTHLGREIAPQVETWGY